MWKATSIGHRGFAKHRFPNVKPPHRVERVAVIGDRIPPRRPRHRALRAAAERVTPPPKRLPVSRIRKRPRSPPRRKPSPSERRRSLTHRVRQKIPVRSPPAQLRTLFPLRNRPIHPPRSVPSSNDILSVRGSRDLVAAGFRRTPQRVAFRNESPTPAVVKRLLRSRRNRAVFVRKYRRSGWSPQDHRRS